MLEMTEGFAAEEESQPLTVLKTCLFFAGDGFCVYDCKGHIVFRVDSYGPHFRHKAELVLMDSSGKSILTVRRKKPSLHHRWEGFLGERIEGQKALFSVWRSSIIGRRSNVVVEVFRDQVEEYQVEGSFTQRSCTMYDSSREIMAEVCRKKDVSANVTLGKDVFSLWVRPGFDAAFVMAVIVILDQIYGDDENADPRRGSKA